LEGKEKKVNAGASLSVFFSSPLFYVCCFPFSFHLFFLLEYLLFLSSSFIFSSTFA
jgi:hypothetical protein